MARRFGPCRPAVRHKIAFCEIVPAVPHLLTKVNSVHHHNLLGKRVLTTRADQFMGPELCRVFAEHGAAVIADTDPLRDRDAPAAAVAAAGPVDILVVNLAIAAPTTPAAAVSEQE